MASILRSMRPPPRIVATTYNAPSARLVLLFTGAHRHRAHIRLLQTSHPRARPAPTLVASAASTTSESASEPICPPDPEHPNPPAEPLDLAGNTGKGEYFGPLAQSFRRLKIFSLSSLALSTLMTPFIFIIETASAVPLVGRVALALTVLGTSGVSTALVAWTGRPYVHALRWLPKPDAVQGDSPNMKTVNGVEMKTFTFKLHEVTTRVYDAAFLVPSPRPFATWELAERFVLPPAEAEAERNKGLLPREETVAEQLDYFENVEGRWIVRWAEDGTGTCYPQGKFYR